MADYYEILGLDRNSSDEDIKKAYRKKAFDTHPDRNTDDPSGENFKKVQEAYDILGDTTKKKYYDTYGKVNNGYHHPPFNDVSSIFEQFFNGKPLKERGNNLQVKITISLEEVLSGCIKKVNVTKKVICDSCSGKGYASFNKCPGCNGTGHSTTHTGVFVLNVTCRQCQGSGKTSIVNCSKCMGKRFSHNQNKEIDIVIPAGVRDKDNIILHGEGESSKDNICGDLYVVISVKEHHFFKRENNDIICEIPISYCDLVLGKKLVVPTLDGKPTDFDIPERTQSNTKFRIKGFGLPSVNYHNGKQDINRGDLVAIIKLEVPAEITDKYKKYVEKLRDLEINCSMPKKDSFNKL